MALATGGLPAGAAAAVAHVLGESLSAAELAQAEDESARVARLRDWIWARVQADFIAAERLAATPGEIAELSAYDREFERRDREQRARKLAELNERLARADLADAERKWLEEFRRVLGRMAERDAGNDRVPPSEREAPAVDYAPWVEFWKVNRVLYERYGGIVVATAAGPVPSGAWQALIEEYERRGEVHVPDTELRRQLRELLSNPPARVLPADRVDFTPFWKLPIPPSYFPE